MLDLRFSFGKLLPIASSLPTSPLGNFNVVLWMCQLIYDNWSYCAKLCLLGVIQFSQIWVVVCLFPCLCVANMWLLAVLSLQIALNSLSIIAFQWFLVIYSISLISHSNSYHFLFCMKSIGLLLSSCSLSWFKTQMNPFIERVLVSKCWLKIETYVSKTSQNRLYICCIPQYKLIYRFKYWNTC